MGGVINKTHTSKLSYLKNIFIYYLFIYYFLHRVLDGIAVSFKIQLKLLLTLLDTLFFCIGVMQVFASTGLAASPGLFVLVSQMAVPISMVLTRIMLKTRYNWYHYVGAVIVFAGLIVALIPQLKDVVQ